MRKLKIWSAAIALASYPGAALASLEACPGDGLLASQSKRCRLHAQDEFALLQTNVDVQRQPEQLEEPTPTADPAEQTPLTDEDQAAEDHEREQMEDLIHDSMEMMNYIKSHLDGDVEPEEIEEAKEAADKAHDLFEQQLYDLSHGPGDVEPEEFDNRTANETRELKIAINKVLAHFQAAAYEAGDVEPEEVERRKEEADRLHDMQERGTQVGGNKAHPSGQEEKHPEEVAGPGPELSPEQEKSVAVAVAPSGEDEKSNEEVPGPGPELRQLQSEAELTSD